jgi:hypothetical protein
MERDDSTEKEEELEDDQRALLNLERNIENIERSMSASQLEQANYPGKSRGVREEQRQTPPHEPNFMARVLVEV